MTGVPPYLRDIPVITPNGALAAKPDASLIREACRRLEVSSGILIDDDLQIGMLTARNANITFIHYTGE